MNLSLWIQQVFHDVIESPTFDETLCAKYFSPDYVQQVDGKTLNYEHFVAHLKALKAATQSMTVTFQHVVVQGDIVATLHFVEAIKTDKSRVSAQVNAFFEVRDGKIVHCNELTRVTHGSAEDKDIGSRT